MLAVLLVMAAVILAETSALFAREFFNTKEQRVEREMQKPPPDPIDEGFENIMRYAVNGKTGFERE